MAVVELRLPALPEHVRTARLVALAAARRAGLDDRYVDELRLALGEACARAVGQHRRHAPDAPVVVAVSDHPGGLSVAVTDQGPPAGPSGGAESIGDDLLDGSPDEDDPDVSPDLLLALLGGLVDDVTVEPGADGTGTTVTMRWPLPVTVTSGTPSTSVAPA